MQTTCLTSFTRHIKIRRSAATRPAQNEFLCAYPQIERESAEYIVWEFNVDAPGTFQITGECIGGHLEKAQDRKVLLTLMPDNAVTTVITSDDTRDGLIDLGRMRVGRAGKQKLVIEVRGGRDNAVFLKGLRLKRQ